MFSVNGNWNAPNGMAFENVAINLPWISPGLSGQTGKVRYNFGDRDLKF